MPSAARWWPTSAPAPAARRWRWARHAQHRAAVRLRRVGAPAGVAEAAPGAQRPVQRHPVGIAHERDERIKRLSGKLDRVLVDAPCSGLGTLRRNPDLKWRQSPEAVAELTPSSRPSWQRRVAPAQARRTPGLRHLQRAAPENEDVAAFSASRRRRPD
jgi:hypothetical protein